jgi:hypothetical protein
MVMASAPGVQAESSFTLTNTTAAPAAITATGGSLQSASLNTAFTVPLAVAVVDQDQNPVESAIVVFTGPATGAGGIFGGTGTNTATATTNASGVATSPVFTANGTIGTYAVLAVVAGVSTSATFSLTNTAGPSAMITATAGQLQSATIDTTFATLLSATVVDSSQNPVNGALVTFSAPASGASGTFADTGTNTTTATTNANGTAVAAGFTANGADGIYVVTATVAGVSTPAQFSLTNVPKTGPPAAIMATNGATQTTTINTAFAVPLSATVVDSLGNPVNGALVTFTAPTTGASGAFADTGTNTATATTNVSGVARSTTFTANGTSGSYTVPATVAGVSSSANFSLTNSVSAKTYVFQLDGQEATGPNFYALAGSVQVDSSGTILAGEQDYNDGLGITSPEPSGDSISGGTLTVDPTTGQGTLTLNTNNANLGVGGIETLGVQFVNANHALVIQFDGIATSSGSMDLQTPASALSGGYAFTMTGVDPFYSPVSFGGVFSVTGATTLENGLLDTNDSGFGAVITGTQWSGTLSAPDSFGRGTIVGFNNPVSVSPISLNYYIVSPEAVRIVDVDTSDSGIGSAFGQGINSSETTNASIGNSVFGVAGGPFLVYYGAAGMLVPSNTSSSVADFSGVADDSELSYGVLLAASPISGTYSVSSNGYGSLAIVGGRLGDVSALGLYMTDPNLNLTDPNNTTTGLGGALVADMDVPLAGGTGILIPQTDTSPASFTGNYAFGAQAVNDFCCEFDFVGQGSVTSGTFAGTGLVSDPFFTLGGNTTNSGITFAGAPLPDAGNVGRYTMFSTNNVPNPLNITVNGITTGFDVAIYQASGGQLLWVNEDVLSVFLGSLEQRGSLTGLPAARKTVEHNKAKRAK